jgi:tRNA 2-(methylsulfanyl)-N6-isopentenyladenosine37 hydroxylase
VNRSAFFTDASDCSIDAVTDVVPQLADALPLVPSDPRWLEVALADLEAVHADHLHCLAHDETRHVVQVAQLMARRGQAATYDHGDDYAAALRTHIRVREPDRLLDRLLVFAIIEGRSAERLGLLAGALADPRARDLYASLTTAEVRHRDTFLALARDAAPTAWRARAAELAELEAGVLRERTVIARIH